MQLVEQHIISKGDPRFQNIDEMALASKCKLRLSSRHNSVPISGINFDERDTQARLRQRRTVGLMEPSC
jgi:hypothetical protein